MRHRTVPMLGIALCVAGAVIAQEVGTQPQNREAATQPQNRGAATQPRQERTALRPTGESTTGESTTGKELDKPIATMLLLGNQEEVTLAKFAQERSQNEQVKQFAQEMAQAHQQAISQLEKFATQGASHSVNGQQRTTQPGSSEARTATSTSSAPSDSATDSNNNSSSTPGNSNSANASGRGDANNLNARGQSASGSGESHQMLALHKAIAEQCLAMTQKELSEKEGPEFDKCYMGQQIVAHIQMVAKLTGSEQFASSELQQIVGKQRKTAEHHLQMAKQVMKQLESESQTTAQETTRTPGQ